MAVYSSVCSQAVLYTLTIFLFILSSVCRIILFLLGSFGLVEVVKMTFYK